MGAMGDELIQRRSIALLDLHARADQFQDDAALGALVGRQLEFAGITVGDPPPAVLPPATRM